MHIALTVYTEGLFIAKFIEKTNLYSVMDEYPTEAVMNHKIANDNDRWLYAQVR